MLQFRVAADEEQESHLEPLSSLESDYFPAVVCREQMTRLLFLTHKVPLLGLNVAWYKRSGPAVWFPLLSACRFTHP